MTEWWQVRDNSEKIATLTEQPQTSVKIRQFVKLAHLDQVHIRVRRQVGRIEHRLAIWRKPRVTVRVLIVERTPVERQDLGSHIAPPSHWNNWMYGLALLSLVNTKAASPSPTINFGSRL